MVVAILALVVSQSEAASFCLIAALLPSRVPVLAQNSTWYAPAIISNPAAATSIASPYSTAPESARPSRRCAPPAEVALTPRPTSSAFSASPEAHHAE